MKKKHRDIVVDDVAYAYVRYGRGKEHDIAIWKDGKRLFNTTVRTSEVTPSLIASIIKDYVKLEKETDGRIREVR